MNKAPGQRSIFRSLFVPMIFIMLLQAIIFYAAAVYGGIEESLRQNAVDILSERLYNRKNELETRFNNRWTELGGCIAELDELYRSYESDAGAEPLTRDAQLGVDFLGDSADSLVAALRYTQANGIFLILNDSAGSVTVVPDGGAQLYGLCIRDMDPDSNYSGREDLQLERSPSSIIDMLGCQLDSWWEAKYEFLSEADGDFYYEPLDAAWADLGGDSDDLAYFSDMHRISGSDPKVVSYSVPLISDNGFPYAVLGVELTEKYLASLLPERELNETDKCCYVLALRDEGSDTYQPLVGSGSLYNRCFGETAAIETGGSRAEGGFTITGRDGAKLYTVEEELRIYNNNSPFESRHLVLLAMVESDTLFSFIGRVKVTLLLVSLLSLLLGVIGLGFVSRRFAAPITALAQRVKEAAPGYKLGRLGISEIDQLVDSIDELNRNVSRNSARTEFFSRMSHDMRTPMNAIISFSSSEMLENADEALKDDYLDKIHASGIYLLGLINEVLDMTKIESNKIQLRPSVVRAASLFDAVVPMIAELAQQKSVSFTTDIDIQPELTVMADSQHIDQIVMNLLSNAVKFTPEGGSVRLAAHMENGGCHITVADTGIGMSKDFMDKLYTPFAQESGSHEGTGLGLSIAKKLTELMGGSIDCESSQNAGTTFRVSLPLPEADTKPANPAKTATPKDISALKGRKVLVCEDNAINTRIITRLLVRVGLEVDVAENGAVGVERFARSISGKYAAILMDIRMPVMDGLDATRAIRAMAREDAQTVPIIAMTADAFDEDAETSISAGMNEHLSKPIDTGKLYDTLAAYIR